MDQLSLFDVSSTQQGVEVHFDRLGLKWNPARLLVGEIRIGALALEKGDILLFPATAEKSLPPGKISLAWPEAALVPSWLDLEVEQLRATDIRIRKNDQLIQHIPQIEGRISLQGGRLDLNDLDLVLPPGRYTGKLTLDLPTRRVDAEVNLTLSRTGGIFDQLVFALHLESLHGEEPSGTLDFTGLGSGEARLQLASRLRLSGPKVHLSDMVLVQPGRQGRVLGEGHVELGANPLMDFRLRVENLDLRRETTLACGIDAEVEARGTLQDYDGSVQARCKGQGWQAITLSGPFSGSLEGLEFPSLLASFLQGRVEGRLGMLWRNGFELESDLRGRGLVPSILRPDLQGVLNLDVKGDLRVSKNTPQQTSVSAVLVESTLHGRAMHGQLDARLQGTELDLSHMEIHGSGFDLSARGRLSERIGFEARVARLEAIEPRLTGQLQGSGWVRLSNGDWSGSAAVKGRTLGAAGLTLEQFDLRAAAESPGGLFRIDAQGNNARYKALEFSGVRVMLEGTPAAHQAEVDFTWQGGAAEAQFTGGWGGARGWSGLVEKLAARDADLGSWHLTDKSELMLASKGVSLPGFHLQGPGQAALDAAVKLAWSAGAEGEAKLNWREMDLGLLQPLMGQTRLKGRSNGALDMRIRKDGTLFFDGKAHGRGGIDQKGLKLDFDQAELSLLGTEKGWQGSLGLALAGGGGLTASLSSDEPARFALPSLMRVQAGLERFDLGLLEKKMPPGLHLTGTLSAGAVGVLDGPAGLNLKGHAETSGGCFLWRGKDGETGLALDRAVLRWSWAGESLEGAMDLDLAEQGRVKGRVSLPLAARLPAVLDPEGTLEGRLEAELKEMGLLSVFFPALVDESRGDLNLTLTLGGTWDQPQLAGTFGLEKAGGYLPGLGVTLGDVGARGTLQGDRVVVESFEASSGPGKVQGSGSIRLTGRALEGYQFHLEGKSFQALRLQEIEFLVDPNLEISGNTQRVKVRGAILVPEMLLSKAQKQDLLTESADVILLGDAPSTNPVSSLGLDLQVKLTLGDKVLLNLSGLDARVGGEIDLYGTDLRQINAKGRFEVREGHYSTYGVKLKITRGYLLFAGVPVDRPTLDVLAVRNVGEVLAGVQVGGTPRQPVVKLYSEPPMPETDILSYVVLGRSMGAESPGQADLLMKAAGFLLNKGDSAVLQDRIKRLLGLDVIEVESGGDAVSGSMVMLGKYLTPNLYVSYGRSIFSDASAAQLRYTLGKHWEVESKLGEQSGADLYYKIEFK